MEKDGSGGGNDNDSGKQPSGNADNIMDAASLFGAYWGRDGGAAAAAAAQQQAALFANFGGGGGRYPQQSTLNVAANQAAQLGMHPAASAAWWQMASQLAAQDYLARLQASGLGFPPMSDPYAALSALGGMGQLSKQPSSKSSSGSKAKAPSTQTDRSGRSSSNSTASSSSVKEKSPANQGGHGSLRSYNYPKTSDSYGAPGNPSSASSSLASLSSLVSAHSSKHSRPQSKQSQPSKSPTVSSSLKERDLAALRSDLMMGYHAQNKQMSPLFANPFAAMGGSDKDRHSNLEQLASLQHSIMSDPASVLGGVRLPPDTEIIKYTSAISGPKQPPGSTNRGRKKTISLDPPHVSVLPSAPPPLKRAKMDQSESSRERHRNETARPPPFSLSDYAGLSRELLQSIASQSGISLSALEKQLAGTTTSSTSTNEAECLNLTRSSSTGSARTTEKRKSESPMDLGSGKKTPQIPTPLLDEDGPLNLSLKPSSSSDLRVSDMSRGSDALSKLSSLSSSLSVTTPSQDRVSRRKPGAKPRRVLPESMSPPRPRSSGSEDSEAARTEGSGRPRNLGRGVSKPKKNTVASLLAQSRALGLKPAIAQQLLTETDPEKIRQLLGEACASTDSECPSDSMSDSDTSDRHQDTHLRLPLALGWRRETLIKGLSRTGCVKGEVAYTAPDGHTVIRSEEQLNQYLEKNPNPPLGKDNFSFSSRIILGSYLQPGVEPNDYVTISEGELLKRVEEFRGSVPPVEKRMELAKQQQRHRDQARIARELERNDKAEMAKREKELRSQQILEERRMKQEEAEKIKLEEQARRQQEREQKRQQAVLIKEQKYMAEVNKQRELIYTVELERERRRQHSLLIRQLETRKRWEEKERKKHQSLLDRLLSKEKKLEIRKREMEILAELRRPQEDSTLDEVKPLPVLERIPGLKLPGQAMSDILMVYEFIHNFGQTLGFDMESLPSLDVLQTALLPDSPPEPEGELVSLLTHLLVCAIEDPGIPHPGRHTTLLGHALRTSDITPDTISETLRIYLYANATGEVKSQFGLHQERERDKRIADHHQTDEEMAQTYSQPKNATYFKHLRDNTTYQLSEKLNTKPFLALNATDKSKILAFVCNELLQNKGVLRQIDASLDHLNALKKERYLLDAKIRKVRSLRGRTARAEAADRSLALNAIEKISTHHIQEQDATSNQTHPETPIDHTMDSTDERERDADSEREKDGDMEKDGESEREKEGDRIESEREQDSECRDDEMETPMSDDESEGMQHDEEEDSRMSSEELTKKLERLLKTSEQLLIQLSHAQHSLRATCFGQDRYWRRYWWLGKAGGILVEAMESAQPELMNYMLALEGCPLKVDPESNPELFAEKSELVDPSLKTDAQIKSELELKNIKSELNLSDHTQIIKYEPNVQNCKTEAIQMEEKYIQQHQNQHQEDMLDIEDSIPTAFLVQKPTHNNKPYEQNADEQKTDETPPKETPKPEEKVNELINNLDELKKMAESVTENLEKSIEDVKDEKENVNLDSISRRLHQKTVDGKWFSIIRHEKPLTYDSEVVYEDNSKSCAEIVMCQGPKWDVVNNLFQLRKPSLFTTSMVLNSLPSSNYYPDSCLTLSGLDQELVDCKNIVTKEEDEDQPEPAQEQPKPNATCTKNVVHASLSSYLQCESPPPLQLAEEERDQLGRCLQRGGPPKAKRVEAVQRDLRYGWWRIRDGLKLRELINSLATRGVRERELHNTILHHLNVIDLQFATGENTSVIFSKSDLDDIIERNEGYPLADVKHSINIDAMERIHAHLLETVKLLEERVCAASVQEKSWKPSKETHQPDSESLSKAKNALIALESAIERRYLKPPLGTRSDASDTTAVLQAESQANTNTQSPQFQDKHNNDNSSGNDAKCGTAPRGLYHWREGVGRARSAAQLHALRSALDSAIAWDKSIMKANCQFCSSGEHEDKLLLCDGCDKGYHTYCFKPKMDKIPEGDWYCFECVNKARGVKACIVCGGNSGGAKKLFACSLCPRAYHPDCHYPPLLKNPRGKWYCANCISKAPPKKPRASAKKRDSKGRELLNASSDFESSVPSPAASAASSSTLAEDQPHENGLHHANSPEPEQPPPPIVEDEEPPEKKRPSAPPTPANGTLQNSHLTNKCESPPEEQATSPAKENKNSSSAKKEKVSAKKLQKDLQFCRNILEQMERHRDAWPFLLPVNTKQFPSYKKIIRIPMDLSTIKKKLNDLSYKCKEEFAADVRQIFTNCEVFNEDDSPVGQAGHGMRQFFEQHFGAQN